MPQLLFFNSTTDLIQLCYYVSGAPHSSQIPPGQQYAAVDQIAEGETILWWWRNDGCPCVQCDDAGAPCNQQKYEVHFADPVNPEDLRIVIDFPLYPVQTA